MKCAGMYHNLDLNLCYICCFHILVCCSSFRQSKQLLLLLLLFLMYLWHSCPTSAKFPCFCVFILPSCHFSLSIWITFKIIFGGSACTDIFIHLHFFKPMEILLSVPLMCYFIPWNMSYFNFHPLTFFQFSILQRCICLQIDFFLVYFPTWIKLLPALFYWIRYVLPQESMRYDQLRDVVAKRKPGWENLQNVSVNFIFGTNTCIQ